MKNERGITLITLAITIVVMIILTFTISVNIEPYLEQRERSNFETDMQSLKEEIEQYYSRVKDLPLLNKYTDTSMIESIKNANDDDEYYVLDIRQLEVKLNNGSDYAKALEKGEDTTITSSDNLRDLYIINKQSHTIYYPKGVEYSGSTHYRLPEVYTIIDNEKPTISYDSEKIIDLDTTIDSEYIKNNNSISDNKSSISEIEIANLVIKNSNNEVVENTLDKYDIYTVNYTVRDKDGNSTELITQKMITKPNKSITLTNIIPNCSFESGVSGWGNGSPVLGNDKSRTGNYSLKYTVSKSQAFIRINFGDLGIKDKNIYVRSYVFKDSQNTSPLMYVYAASDANMWPSDQVGTSKYIKNLSSYNKWEMCSIIFEKSNSIYNNLLMMLAQGNTSGEGTLWWDDLLGFDLAPFGDNVPTNEWLDYMIPYFEGTETFNW